MAHVNNKTVVPCPKKSVREKKSRVVLLYFYGMVFFELLWSKYHCTPKYYHGITYTLVN